MADRDEAAVLAPRYGAGAATGVALVTRLAVTLGEVLAVCAIWLPYYATRRLRRTLAADTLVDDELR